MPDITTTTYIQVAKSPGGYSKGRIVSHSIRPPTAPESGAVIIRLTINIPERAFRDYDATATIDVPADLAELTTVAVDATDPRAETT